MIHHSWIASWKWSFSITETHKVQIFLFQTLFTYKKKYLESQCPFESEFLCLDGDSLKGSDFG